MWFVPAFRAMLMNARETIRCILTFCLPHQMHAGGAVGLIPMAMPLPHALERSMIGQLITFF